MGRSDANSDEIISHLACACWHEEERALVVPSASSFLQLTTLCCLFLPHTLAKVNQNLFAWQLCWSHCLTSPALGSDQLILAPNSQSISLLVLQRGEFFKYYLKLSPLLHPFCSKEQVSYISLYILWCVSSQIQQKTSTILMEMESAKISSPFRGMLGHCFFLFSYYFSILFF